MVSTVTPAGALGMLAPPFDLPGVDGRRHTVASARGPNGLVVMFICNHCPYVKAVIDKIVRDTNELAAHGVGSIADVPSVAECVARLREEYTAAARDLTRAEHWPASLASS